MGSARKLGRNRLCPCGSGRKYKACCLTLHKGGGDTIGPVEPDSLYGIAMQIPWILQSGLEILLDADATAAGANLDRFATLLDDGRLASARFEPEAFDRAVSPALDAIRKKRPNDDPVTLRRILYEQTAPALVTPHAVTGSARALVAAAKAPGWSQEDLLSIGVALATLVVAEADPAAAPALEIIFTQQLRQWITGRSAFGDAMRSVAADVIDGKCSREDFVELMKQRGVDPDVLAEQFPSLVEAMYDDAGKNVEKVAKRLEGKRPPELFTADELAWLFASLLEPISEAKRADRDGSLEAMEAATKRLASDLVAALDDIMPTVARRVEERALDQSLGKRERTRLGPLAMALQLEPTLLGKIAFSNPRFRPWFRAEDEKPHARAVVHDPCDAEALAAYEGYLRNAELHDAAERVARTRALLATDVETEVVAAAPASQRGR